MNIQEFQQIIAQGESLTVEFKSWIKAKDFKERMNLVVPELVALANAKGGCVFLGVEDSGDVTGCTKFDLQNIIESVYSKTNPPLFIDNPEVIMYEGKQVIILPVKADGNVYTMSNGRCLRLLGKNSKPWFPQERSMRYFLEQGQDFSAKVIVESSLDDIDKLAVYQLKEKIKVREPKSALPLMDDIPFLRDLEFIKVDQGCEKLTVSGLLFIGKETAIQKLLPQAEVIYLHYSVNNTTEYDSRLDLKKPILQILDRLTEKIQDTNKIINVQIGLFRLEIPDFSEPVFQEALLNALTHRDYQKQSSIYVKHYPDELIIESPGGFPEDITAQNIITHPSVPRNKLIAETLQRLKYVQRTGQGVDIIFRGMLTLGKPFPEYQAFSEAVVLKLPKITERIDFVRFIVQEEDQRQAFSLPEIMILRYLYENKRINLRQTCVLTQMEKSDAQKCCRGLRQRGLIETAGKEYMLTPRVYEAVKNDIAYVKDKYISEIKAKDRIQDYLVTHTKITNEIVRELCDMTRIQARRILKEMVEAGILEMHGQRKNTYYCLKRI